MSRERLRRLSRRELAPREIAEVLRHIGGCEECARMSAAGVEAQLGALPAVADGDEGPWHPDHAEIAAYVDGAAGPAEREIVASHLEDCPLCREDVADLAKLRRPLPPRRAWPAVMATAAALTVAVILVQRSGDRREPVHRPPDHLPAVTTPPPAPSTAPSVTAAHTPPRYSNPEWDRLVRTAIETGRLPFAPGIGAAPDTLRGSDVGTAPDIAPSGVVLDDVRPRFSWPAREGVTYVVSIFSGDRRVAQSAPLTETRWTPDQPLARGRTYVWQVQATRTVDGQTLREIIPAPPAPPATFHLVSKSEHDELAEARRQHPEDHLLHAVLAARAGLREEAVRALASSHTKLRAD
jgi:hypothetical protein